MTSKEDYYNKESRVASQEELRKGNTRYIERYLYKEVKEKCKGLDCSTLLANAANRKIKKGDLGKTCRVIEELIKHIVGTFGWYCVALKLSKEFDAEENSFWIEWEIAPSSDEKRKLSDNIKKSLRKDRLLRSEKMMDLVTKEMLETKIAKVLVGIERSTPKIIKAKFLINTKIGSPP